MKIDAQIVYRLHPNPNVRVVTYRRLNFTAAGPPSTPAERGSQSLGDGRAATRIGDIVRSYYATAYWFENVRTAATGRL